MIEPSLRRADGASAERLAEIHLLALGFRTVGRNFFTRSGEIDLVMMQGETLVFVEVKRRRNGAFGDPSESVTPEKCRRIVRAALVYIHRFGLAGRMVRFDVVIVEPGGVRHIENAFDAGGWYSV